MPIQFEHVVIDADGPQNPHVKAVGDIDGDGFVDVVIPSSNDGPLVWYQFPDWTRHEIAPQGRWSCDAVLVDMDGDGDLDILVSEWYTHSRLEWFENPLPSGDPTADPWRRHIIGGPRAHDIRLGDLDGDGKLEIVTRTQGDDGDHIVVRKHESVDTWSQREIPCPAGEGLALADITGDGRLDIVIGGRWYHAPADIMKGSWNARIFAEWPPDAAVVVSDINGDGRPEVVLTRSEGHHGISWFEVPNNPDEGPWAEHIVDDDVDYAHSLRVCDLNNNGELDIVTAEMHQSSRKRVLAYLNQGAGEAWERQVVTETGSHNLCVADIGNTGRPDLIGANWSGDYQPVEMWRQVD